MAIPVPCVSNPMYGLMFTLCGPVDIKAVADDICAQFFSEFDGMYAKRGPTSQLITLFSVRKRVEEVFG